MPGTNPAWSLALALMAACGAVACGGGGDAAAGGGGEAAGGASGAGGGVVLDDMGAGGGVAGGAGGAGGEAGGEGGTGGTFIETPVEERCPDLQAGEYLLIAFPDRVDAYRQRDFEASYFCKFLDLAGNGITNAGGIARSTDNDGPFYVTSTKDGRGVVHSFDANGTFIGKVATNVNLAEIAGLWSKFSGDGYVAWSKANSNFYELTADAQFVGPWIPATIMTSRLENLTDLFFVDAESAVVTFSNRPPKLYKRPNAPDFPAENIGAANAVTGIPTEEGMKLLISGEVGGAGNGYGVILYKPVVGGRQAPEQQAVLVNPGEFSDGIGLLALGSGFLLLDSAIGGSARLVTFDADGVLQEEIGLDGGGDPHRMFFSSIFPDF